jgi:hypothetical protein
LVITKIHKLKQTAKKKFKKRMNVSEETTAITNNKRRLEDVSSEDNRKLKLQRTSENFTANVTVKNLELVLDQWQQLTAAHEAGVMVRVPVLIEPLVLGAYSIPVSGAWFVTLAESEVPLKKFINQTPIFICGIVEHPFIPNLDFSVHSFPQFEGSVEALLKFAKGATDHFQKSDETEKLFDRLFDISQDYLNVLVQFRSVVETSASEKMLKLCKDISNCSTSIPAQTGELVVLPAIPSNIPDLCWDFFKCGPLLPSLPLRYLISRREEQGLWDFVIDNKRQFAILDCNHGCVSVKKIEHENRKIFSFIFFGRNVSIVDMSSKTRKQYDDVSFCIFTFFPGNPNAPTMHHDGKIVTLD